mmetsp:Transcript_31777/g.47382  ORF Transcript_31777/g.47382 Transcript_31777/m.47382 type:complete len:122 (-) Transcript_31777:354-719(-)
MLFGGDYELEILVENQSFEVFCDDDESFEIVSVAQEAYEIVRTPTSASEDDSSFVSDITDQSPDQDSVTDRYSMNSMASVLSTYTTGNHNIDVTKCRSLMCTACQSNQQPIFIFCPPAAFL